MQLPKQYPVTACNKDLCILEHYSKVMNLFRYSSVVLSYKKKYLKDASKLSSHSNPMASKIAGVLQVLVTACRLLSISDDQKLELFLIKTLPGLTPGMRERSQ